MVKVYLKNGSFQCNFFKHIRKKHVFLYVLYIINIWGVKTEGYSKISMYLTKINLLALKIKICKMRLYIEVNITKRTVHGILPCKLHF